jgi:hypothetical protein
VVYLFGGEIGKKNHIVVPKDEECYTFSVPPETRRVPVSFIVSA